MDAHADMGRVAGAISKRWGASCGGWVMGWGEPHRPSNVSAGMTARAELERTAAALADAVAEHRREQTTGNADRMYVALDRFADARKQVLFG